MPCITRSSYPGPPFWQFNGHLQTIAPGLFRRVNGIVYERERMETPDGDFLDLDWLKKPGNRRLVVLTHGLEGDSDRQYIRGTAKLFHQNGWDVLAWNCRSCSGEMNRQFKLYHHGDVEDISSVIDFALATGRYDEIAMVGYSMGGNITLKYCGTLGEAIPFQVKKAVAFSVPCSLQSASDKLDRWDNAVYRVRFKKSLDDKIRKKHAQFPGKLDVNRLNQVRKWRDFDEWFSAPICGYRSADDFYQNSSANNFAGGTRIPALIVNAWNDPILTADSMPERLAGQHDFLYLETPAAGGHCGFQVSRDEFSWSERRALEFCSTDRHLF